MRGAGRVAHNVFPCLTAQPSRTAKVCCRLHSSSYEAENSCLRFAIAPHGVPSSARLEVCSQLFDGGLLAPRSPALQGAAGWPLGYCSVNPEHTRETEASEVTRE